MKYLWIYPSNKKALIKEGLVNSWIFYGTEKQYTKWLKDLPADNIRKILNKSGKWEQK